MHFCVSFISAWWFVRRFCYIIMLYSLLFPTHLMCTRHSISERLTTYLWFQPGSVKFILFCKYSCIPLKTPNTQGLHGHSARTLPLDPGPVVVKCEMFTMLRNLIIFNSSGFFLLQYYCSCSTVPVRHLGRLFDAAFPLPCNISDLFGWPFLPQQ